MACSMLWLGVDSLGNPNQFDLLDDKRLGLGWAGGRVILVIK